MEKAKWTKGFRLRTSRGWLESRLTFDGIKEKPQPETEIERFFRIKYGWK